MNKNKTNLLYPKRPPFEHLCSVVSDYMQDGHLSEELLTAANKKVFIVKLGVWDTLTSSQVGEFFEEFCNRYGLEYDQEGEEDAESGYEALGEYAYCFVPELPNTLILVTSSNVTTEDIKDAILRGGQSIAGYYTMSDFCIEDGSVWLGNRKDRNFEECFLGNMSASPYEFRSPKEVSVDEANRILDEAIADNSFGWTTIFSTYELRTIFEFVCGFDYYPGVIDDYLPEDDEEEEVVEEKDDDIIRW